MLIHLPLMEESNAAWTGLHWKAAMKTLMVVLQATSPKRLKGGAETTQAEGVVNWKPEFQ